MSEDRQTREHPFDTSCVEGDMIAKVFGWASDLHHDPTFSAWRALLAEVGVVLHESPPDLQVKFFAFPKHFGGGAGEIGDIVLLGKKQCVVVEAKRPGVVMDAGIDQKRLAAEEVARRNKWPAPCFVAIGTKAADCPGFRLLEWATVSAVYRMLLGKNNPISQYIDRQIRARGADQPSREQDLQAKPRALREVDSRLTANSMDASCKGMPKPGPHWTYRRRGNTSAFLVALPLEDEAIQLRFRQVPPECLGDGRILVKSDFYAKGLGRHKYAINAPDGWPDDPSLAALIEKCLEFVRGPSQGRQ